MTFSDPAPSQFTGETLLERVARAYESKVEEYGDACDEAAIAENAYLREFAMAWAVAVEDSVPSTTRAKHCDQQSDVLAARLEWNRKVAAEKRLRAKVTELQNRMTAAMSYARFIREGTGG
jgi:hypothetical protein